MIIYKVGLKGRFMDEKQMDKYAKLEIFNNCKTWKYFFLVFKNMCRSRYLLHHNIVFFY